MEYPLTTCWVRWRLLLLASDHAKRRSEAPNLTEFFAQCQCIWPSSTDMLQTSTVAMLGTWQTSSSNNRLRMIQFQQKEGQYMQGTLSHIKEEGRLRCHSLKCFLPWAVWSWIITGETRPDYYRWNKHLISRSLELGVIAPLWLIPEKWKCFSKSFPVIGLEPLTLSFFQQARQLPSTYWCEMPVCEVRHQRSPLS